MSTVTVACRRCGLNFPRRGPKVFCSQLCGRRARPSATPRGRFLLGYVAGATDACWPWRRGTRNGYGVFGVGTRATARTYNASRYALAVADGLLDADGFVNTQLHALHTCDNPICVNPRHLFWGTNMDNIQDRMAKGRSPTGHRHHSFLKPETVSRGETAKRSRLTEMQVREILRRHGCGISQITLASEFGVSRGCIAHVVNGSTWKHVSSL